MVPEYWWPYLYQYGVGAGIFAIGIYLILRNGGCVLSRAQDRRWFVILIAGFLWFAGIHLIWYLVALHVLPHSLPGAGT